MARAQLAMWGLGTSTQTVLSFGFFRIFFSIGIGPCGPVPHPPIEWTSFPPLVAAVLITPQGAEPPGSRRIGVKVRWFIFFHPKPSWRAATERAVAARPLDRTRVMRSWGETPLLVKQIHSPLDNTNNTPLSMFWVSSTLENVSFLI